MGEAPKKPRFNIFDAVVLFLIVILAVLVFWYVKIRPSGALGDSWPCRVVFEVEWTWVDAEIAEAAKGAAIRGDIIKDSVRGYYLGKAYTVEIKEDKVTTFDSLTGSYIETVSPGKYTVYLSVIGNGTESADKLVCEGQTIRVGQKMYVKGKGYAGIGYVTDIYAMPPEKGERGNG